MECIQDASVQAQNLEIKLQQDLRDCHTLFCQIQDASRTCVGHVWDVCGTCLGHVQDAPGTCANVTLELNCTVYNKSSVSTRIGGLSACIGIVVNNMYTVGARVRPEGMCICIRQSTRACGIS